MKLVRLNPIIATPNIKTLTWLRVFLLLQLCCTFSYAATAPIVKDSSRTEVRKPSTERQDEFLNDRDFLYDRLPPVPKTPWERFKDWLGKLFDKAFENDGVRSFWGIFQYVLLAAAVVLIIWLILKNDVRRLFYGKSTSVDIGFREVNENIHEIDFNKLIDEAVAAKNYRRAVRLHFLRALKNLSDKELIRWKTDKTNYDYYQELAKSNHQAAFKDLSFLYDYIWYGDFNISGEAYAASSEKFKTFNDQLKG